LSEAESISNPSSGSPAAAVSSRRRRFFPIFFAVAVIALMAGAGFFAWEQVAHRLVLEPQIAQLSHDVAALRSELQALDARVGALQNASPSADLATQLAALDMRLAETERMLSQAADRDAIATLQTRVARLESGSPGEMLKAAAAILARANLARAAEGSGSFKPEWEGLRAAAPDDPAVTLLQPFADMSVPTHAALAGRFPEVARAALAVEQQASTNGNFASGLWARLRSLISLRRVGDVQGDSNEDHLARAQADMDRGDLAEAVREARAATGPATGPLEPWLRDAEARLAVDSAVLDMNTRIIQALAAAP
jgi:hypothetical protein